MPLAVAGLEDGGRRLHVNGTGGLYKLGTRKWAPQSGNLKELNSSNNLDDKSIKSPLETREKNAALMTRISAQ